MKSVLPEWYPHDDETLGEILRTGTIALDTNALLDLYRVSKQQRTEILDVLSAVRDRLFIPYQVAFEFQRNRLKAVRDNGAIYDSLVDSFVLKQSLLNDIRDRQLKAEVQKLFEDVSRTFKDQLDRLRAEHTLTVESAKKADPVLEALDELLPIGSVGARPKEDVLADRRRTAHQRIKDEVPPGFADAKNKDDPTGDYLIWAELLERAVGTSRPLMFVSNDETKGDWYRAKISGHSLGPLPELVAEMRTALPDHPYHQTNLASFLWLAKKYLGLSVDNETIDSVKQIEIYRSPDDEKRTAHIRPTPSARWQELNNLITVDATLHKLMDQPLSDSEIEGRLALYLAETDQTGSDQQLGDSHTRWVEAMRALRKYRVIRDTDGDGGQDPA